MNRIPVVSASTLTNGPNGFRWITLASLGPLVVVRTLAGGYINVLTRSGDVIAALHNNDVFIDPIDGARSHTGDHAHWRRLIALPLNPRTLAPLLPGFHAHAAALIETVAPAGSCEATRIAEEFHDEVITKLLGLPPQDRELVRDLTNQYDLNELAAYLREVTLAPGLLRNIQDDLTRDELAFVGALLISGGIDTVPATIAFALFELARNPHLRNHLHTHPDQIATRFVDEVVRVHSPATGVDRTTTRDTVVAGRTCPAGTMLRLSIGTTNIEAGDEIEITDGKIVPHRNFGFGAGIHRCPGAHLARLEATAFVTEWLHRIPEFSVPAGYTPTQIDNGPTTLPLHWDT